MHDPMTVAFDIKSPFREKPSKLWPEGYRNTWVTVWHCHPEKDGSDDSCGWFMRGRHGDKEVEGRIAKRFAFEWSHGVPFGWFGEGGDPNFSTQAIVLGMFHIATGEVFGYWSRRQQRFLRKNLFSILHFAENNCDSLYDLVHRPYGHDQDREDKRPARAASIVYGWILRASRPWYKHPRWHVFHIQWYTLEIELRWRGGYEGAYRRHWWQKIWPLAGNVRISRRPDPAPSE